MNTQTELLDKYKETESLIVKFCDEKLNEEYKNICLRLLQKLCRKRPSPLLGGRSHSWAAGIAYAIGSANFIFDKTQEIHMSSQELASFFGISASTASAKASELRDMFEIDHFNPEWLLKELFENNPMTWMIQVNGIICDVRNMPLEIQQEAFEMGIIPFVPGDRIGFTDKKGIDRVVVTKNKRKTADNPGQSEFSY